MLFYPNRIQYFDKCFSIIFVLRFSFLLFHDINFFRCDIIVFSKKIISITPNDVMINEHPSNQAYFHAVQSRVNLHFFAHPTKLEIFYDFNLCVSVNIFVRQLTSSQSNAIVSHRSDA